ncbi:hypothetical protein N0V82_005806 [Gnomoniopsis sp. IMI 355080]|nr:hypothetical protein N0V82_005806 [Gnomoniopsis sp. IMI 355080]
MDRLPNTMRALAARKYTKPEGYEVLRVPVPEIKAPDEVLVRMHASGLSAGDVQTAAGSFRVITKTSFPMILGRMGSGVVAGVGTGVQSFRVGDAVYGMGLKQPMAKYYADGASGWCAEYAVTTADLLLIKPSQLSFEEAAAGLSNLVTAIQFTRACMSLNPEAFPDRTLEGKTVLVTAGLGASTSIAAQYAKNVMGAEKVITTVSTAKVPRVDQYLPGVFDQVVDYQTQNLVSVVGKEKVDFLYNSRFDVMSYLPLMKQGGVIASILGIPTPDIFEQMMGAGMVPFWVKWLLALAQLYYKWKLFGTNIKMKFVSGDAGIREDLEKAGEILATGKVKTFQTIVAFDDLEAIKTGCEQARTLTGKTGQLVVKFI